MSVIRTTASGCAVGGAWAAGAAAGAVAAAPAGLHDVGVAGAEPQRAHLAVRELLHLASVAPHRELVRQGVAAAEQAPRRALRALHARVERHLAEQAHDFAHAQAAAER